MSRLYNTSLDTLLSGEEVIRHFEDLAAKKRRFWQGLFEASIILRLLGLLLLGQGFALLGKGVCLLGSIVSVCSVMVNLLIFDHDRSERLRGWTALAILALTDVCYALGLGRQWEWFDLVYNTISLGANILLLSSGVWWFEWYCWRSARLWLILPLLVLVPLLSAGRQVQNAGLNIRNNPFFQTYRVEEVLFPMDADSYRDVGVEFPDENRLRIAWDGVNWESIGSFTYTPPSQGDPSRGIWVLISEEDPSLTYRLVLEEDETLTLAQYASTQLQWKWKLGEAYRATLFAENAHSRSGMSTSIPWYPSDYPLLEPVYSYRPTIFCASRLTIQLKNPETEALTLHESYYHDVEAEERTFTLSPNDKGCYEWELTPRYESQGDQCAIYRIPYGGGEFRFRLSIGP